MSKFTLILGNKNNSSWSLRGFLALKHAGVEFDEILVALRPRLDRKKLDELTPAGKVPTVKHNDNYIWDSLAICEYFADLYPEKNFWPKDIEIRAHARSVSAEMHSGFAALRNAMPMAIHSTFDCPDISGPLKEDVDRIIEIWSDCLGKYGGPFLFGAYSIADMIYAPVVFRFKSYQVELPSKLRDYCDKIANHSDVTDWMDDADPNDPAVPVDR
jgi:glutathione S-transferase